MSRQDDDIIPATKAIDGSNILSKHAEKEVNIQVGEVVYHTTIGVLTSIPHSYFSELLMAQAHLLSDDCLHLTLAARSGSLFEYILDYLSNNGESPMVNSILADQLMMESILVESKFFKIDRLTDLLEYKLAILANPGKSDEEILDSAVKSKQVHVVSYLIMVKKVQASKRTLAAACDLDNPVFLRLLLQTATQDDATTRLSEICKPDKPEDDVMYIEKVGILLTKSDPNYMVGDASILCRLCESNCRNLGLIDLFARAGADVNFKNRDGTTALLRQCRLKNPDIDKVKKLLEYGANPNSQDQFGAPLHASCKNGHLNVAQLLLTYGADVDAMDSNSDTPMHIAISLRDHAMIKLLIDNNANVYQRNKQGVTCEELLMQHLEMTTNWSQAMKILPLLPIFFDFDHPDKVLPEDIQQKQDIKKLKDYLRSIQQRQFQQSVRKKLMLVGEPRAGKSSFYKRLQGKWNLFKDSLLNKVSLKHEGCREATDGIVIEEWEPAGSNNVAFTVMDYAGQHLYMIMHQFFLSSRNTIYLLFFDASKDIIQANFDFWWSSIHSKAPGSIMMLVGSHTDLISSAKRNKRLGKISEAILANFKRWAANRGSDALHLVMNSSDGKDMCFFPISSTSNHGINTVTTKLLQMVEESNELVPTSVLLLKDKISELKKQSPILKLTEFVERTGVSTSIASKDEDTSTVQSEYNVIDDLVVLSDWGEILYFDDDDALRQYVILNPQWIAHAFKTVISIGNIKDDELDPVSPSTPHSVNKFGLPCFTTTRESSAGRLTLTQMHERWSAGGFNHAYFEFMLDVLLKFEIIVDDPMPNTPSSPSTPTKMGLNSSFSLSGSFSLFVDPTYIVPSLLSPNRPQLLTDHKDWAELTRSYVLDFMPIGMFSRLLVRFLNYLSERSMFSAINDKIEPTIWRNGLVLSKRTSRVVIEIEKVSQPLLSSQTSARSGEARKVSELVMSTTFYHKIHVTCQGELLSICSQNMGWVHSMIETLLNEAYQGIRDSVKILVMCPECLKSKRRSSSNSGYGWFGHRSGGDTPGFLDYAEIKKFVKRSKINATAMLSCPLCCRECADLEILVPELITGPITRSNVEQILELCRVKDRPSDKKKLLAIFTSEACPLDLKREIIRMGAIRVFQDLFSSSHAKNWNILQQILPQIDIKHVKFDIKNNQTLLGKGGYGVVNVALWNNMSVAIKTIPYSKSPTAKNSLERVQREVLLSCLMGSLDHENLMSFYGWSVDQEQRNCYLVMPLANCNLKEHLAMNKGKLTVADKIDAVLQVANALQQLHKVGVVFRDLKTENILVYSGNNLNTRMSMSESFQLRNHQQTLYVLCDFGIARATDLEQGSSSSSSSSQQQPTRLRKKSTMVLGTMQWCAVETLTATNGKKSGDETMIATFKNDIYGFGYLLWSVWNEQEPHENTDLQVLKEIKTKRSYNTNAQQQQRGSATASRLEQGPPPTTTTKTTATTTTTPVVVAAAAAAAATKPNDACSSVDNSVETVVVVDEDLPLPIAPDCIYADLIVRCWSVEPSNRPSMDEIVASLRQLSREGTQTANNKNNK